MCGNYLITEIYSSCNGYQLIVHRLPADILLLHCTHSKRAVLQCKAWRRERWISDANNKHTQTNHRSHTFLSKIFVIVSFIEISNMYFGNLFPIGKHWGRNQMWPRSCRLKCCAMFNTILQFSPMNKIDYKLYNSANISIFLSATEPGLHSHQELHSQFCHLWAQISYFFLLVHCQYSVRFTSWYTSVVLVLDYWKLTLPECTEVESGIETSC